MIIKKKRFKIYFIILLLITIVGVEFMITFLTNEKEKSINTAFEKGISVIENEESPSIAYYIFNEESIIDSFQLGYANIDKKIPVDEDTTYNFLSITKTFTALSIMQLVEDGKISLDENVIHYLPDFEYGSEITVWQLLNHTSGIPNPIPLSWIHLMDERSIFDRDEFFNEIIMKHAKVKSVAGEKFFYSNLGYYYLGLLIEKVSNQKYEEYVSANIIARLSINSDNLSFTINDIDVHAVGYHKKQSFSNLLMPFLINKNKFMQISQGKWNAFNFFYVNGTSYGGLVGKPLSLVKYVQELMKDDSTLLSSEYKQMIFKENDNTGMGLSWFTGEFKNQKYFTHSGGGGGYYCEIRIYPQQKIGSVVFFNRSGMSDERYLDKLDKFYFENREASRNDDLNKSKEQNKRTQ